MRRIGLSVGDPAGIGPEILLRVLPEFIPRAQWVLFGPNADFRAALDQFQPSLQWRPFRGFDEMNRQSAGLWFCPTNLAESAIEPGKPSPEGGRRALAALASAADYAMKGDLDAIVTAPLSKRFAGSGFIGQTEFLRDHTHANRVAMSFFTPTFKVVLATTHVSLRTALDRLSTSLYEELLSLIDREFQILGFARPRVAVTGVNPHAGEHGMFGNDEDEVLAPAVARAVASGMNVSGPLPADSCYQRAHAGEFDIVLAPYHDQGLIPVKLIAPGASANVTLGLPFVRTSPDHGTAFEIAGRGVARTEGMASAIEWALELSNRRHSKAGR